MKQGDRELLNKYFKEQSSNFPYSVFPSVEVDVWGVDSMKLIYAETYVRMQDKNGRWYSVRFSVNGEPVKDENNIPAVYVSKVYNKLLTEIESVRHFLGFTDYVEFLKKEESDRLVETVNQATERKRFSVIKFGQALALSNEEGNDDEERFVNYLKGEQV